MYLFFFTRIKSKTALSSFHYPSEKKNHSQGDLVVGKGTQLLFQTFLCFSIWLQFLVLERRPLQIYDPALTNYFLFFLAWRPHEMEIKVQFMESDSDKMEIRGAVMQPEPWENAMCRWYQQLS